VPGSPAFPEWLEADGRGGFASGTTGLFRTRRYHALQLVATDPPGGRFVLVNGIEAWVETPSGRVPISAQAYGPEVLFLDGAGRVAEFEADPWPRWTFRLPGGGALEQEIFVSRARGTTALGWQARGGGGQQQDQRHEHRKRRQMQARQRIPARGEDRDDHRDGAVQDEARLGIRRAA